MVCTVALKLPQEENAWLSPALIGLALLFLQLPFWMYLIKVSFGKPYLSGDADVDQYLEEMRKTLLAEIRAGKKVIV